MTTSRPAPFALALGALTLVGACGPTVLEGSPCETIGDQTCAALALHQCDGSQWVRVTDCHHECYIAAPTAHDDTQLAGDVTWACEDGPHLVTQAMTISDGASLTIAPGTEVRFAPGARLDTTPSSQLVIDGLLAAPILLTSDDETVGGYGGGNLGGVNLYVRADDGDASSLTWALVERSINGVGLLGLEDGKELPTIENNTMRDNQNWGVLLRGCVGEPTPPDLEGAGNLFFNNGQGAISPCQ
jgi:hypothetical protein